jgi:Outer membrane protein beta-barrel domain
MIRRFRALLLAAAATSLPCADAASQTIPSPYRFLETSQSVGATGGYVLTSDGALQLGPASAAYFGGRYNIRISGPFSAEGELAFMPSTRMVWDTVAGDTTREVIGEADMSLLVAKAGLRFNLTGPRTWRSLQPFVLVGGGIAIDIAGDSPAEEDLPEDMRFDFGTSFAGHIGGGVELFLSDGLSLRADARNVLWKINTPEGFLANDRGRLLPGDEWSQNFLLSAGIAIHF